MALCSLIALDLLKDFRWGQILSKSRHYKRELLDENMDLMDNIYLNTQPKWKVKTHNTPQLALNERGVDAHFLKHLRGQKVYCLYDFLFEIE